jgi:hypothetical protein
VPFFRCLFVAVPRAVSWWWCVSVWALLCARVSAVGRIRRCHLVSSRLVSSRVRWVAAASMWPFSPLLLLPKPGTVLYTRALAVVRFSVSACLVVSFALFHMICVSAVCVRAHYRGLQQVAVVVVARNR